MTLLTPFKRTAIVTAVASSLGTSVATAAPSPSPRIGPLMQLSSLVTSGLAGPVLAGNASGAFVAGWQPYDALTYGNYGQVQLQAFGPDGTPISPVLAVGPDAASHPAVAMDPDGDVVAAWTEISDEQYSPQSSSYLVTVKAQVFSATGSALSGPIEVSSQRSFRDSPRSTMHISRNSSPPLVAMDDTGDFVVAWTSITQAGDVSFYSPIWNMSSSATYAAAYHRDGTLMTPTTTVDQVPLSKPFPYIGPVNADQLSGIAVRKNGDLVLLYNRTRPTQSVPPLARTYGLDLKPLGAPFALNGVSGSALMPYSYGFDAHGNLTAGLTSLVNNVLTTQVMRYAIDGQPLGPASAPIGALDPYCSQTTVTTAPSGRMLTSWGVKVIITLPRSHEIWSCAIHGQYLDSDGSALGAPFLIDSGSDKVNWNGTMATTMDKDGNVVLAWVADRITDGNEYVVARTISAP